MPGQLFKVHFPEHVAEPGLNGAPDGIDRTVLGEIAFFLVRHADIQTHFAFDRLYDIKH